MAWKQLTERDCRQSNLSAIDPHHRHSCSEPATWNGGRGGGGAAGGH